jgi:hypothetical protein
MSGSFCNPCATFPPKHEQEHEEGLNPKSEALNTKQYLNPNAQIQNVLVIWSLVLCICLGFRN